MDMWHSGMWFSGVVMGWQLNQLTSETFSNLNDSMLGCKLAPSRQCSLGNSSVVPQPLTHLAGAH